MSQPSWGGIRGTRQERGYGARWDKLRLRILKRDMYLCQECKRQGRVTPLGVRPYDHAVDHIVSKAQGGDDSHSNLQSLCQYPCHYEKSQREAKQGQGVKPRLEYDDQGFPVWE